MHVKAEVSPRFIFREFLSVDNAPDFVVALSHPIPNGCFLMIGSTGSASMVELHGGVPSGRIRECGKRDRLVAYIALDPDTRDVFVGTPQLETFTREQLLEDLQIQGVRK